MAYRWFRERWGWRGCISKPRALADLLLAVPSTYSMSAQIQAERATYCALLGRTQRGGLNITPWLSWLLECLGQAVAAAEHTLGGVLARARFGARHGPQPLTVVSGRICPGHDVCVARCYPHPNGEPRVCRGHKAGRTA